MADREHSQYILMQKNLPVAELELDNTACTVSAVGQIFEPARVPVGVAVRKGALDRGALNEWWRGRAIPAGRDGIGDFLEELQLPSTQLLLDKGLGLSLSDQYWICPAGSGISWEEVNFFENPFSEDVGNLLLGVKSSGAEISLISPDNTSEALHIWSGARSRSANPSRTATTSR